MPEGSAAVTVHDEAEASRPHVRVSIEGPDGSARTELADFLAAVLDNAELFEREEGSRVVGQVPMDLAALTDRIVRADAYAAELERRNLDLIKQARLAELDKNKEAKIASILEARLGEVTGRKLALQVAHGDVPPEQFEQRRQIEINGIRSLVSAIRV